MAGVGLVGGWDGMYVVCSYVVFGALFLRLGYLYVSCDRVLSSIKNCSCERAFFMFINIVAYVHVYVDPCKRLDPVGFRCYWGVLICFVLGVGGRGCLCVFSFLVFVLRGGTGGRGILFVSFLLFSSSFCLGEGGLRVFVHYRYCSRLGY